MKARRNSGWTRHPECRAIVLAWVAMFALSTSFAFGASGDDQLLLQAAARGEGIQTSLDRGASAAAADAQGRTALHLAAEKGHLAACELLVQRGARVNALDNAGKTPLDLAVGAGHDGVAQFLRSRNGTQSGKGGKSSSGGRIEALGVPILKPSLRWKSTVQFEQEIHERAVLLDSPHVCFFAPARREKEARIVFDYLVKAYDYLHQLTGTHTDYKVAVFAFPTGNPNGWGGTSECSIEYGEAILDLPRQAEWIRHGVPHVSGLVEELAHNFVRATRAQFGWEMVGWSIGMEASERLAPNPVLESALRSTREEQQRTFARYVQGGYRFPADLPANVSDRVHAWILHQAQAQYGTRFWTDFFREVGAQRAALRDATRAGDADTIRNRRYQITIDCFDRLPGLHFKQMLTKAHISLETDIKSLHPEISNWDRRFEKAP